jgi:hypothetical protein
VDTNERDYERDYMTLEDPPVDGTDEPEPEEVPEPINIVSDEIEPATEEELQRVIEEEGKVLEPEIAAFELDATTSPFDLDTSSSPGETREVATRALTYEQLHPTHFNFRADVARLVNRIQRQFPWQTFANTYFQHPPIYGRKYERVSVDFWGGGRRNGRFVGYRGKPIGTALGHRVFRALFNDRHRPNICWIIWNGRMWVRGTGWENSPWGPAGSDPKHVNHVHVTYCL